MGTILIQKETTPDPISLIGREAGVCWGGDVTDPAKNYRRGLDCIVSGHGRTMEYPQIYMVIDGYSARVIRELYTHIAGGPTRLQASTRYIDYESGYSYVIPPKVSADPEALRVYKEANERIAEALKRLEELGVPREDSAMLLPLGMETKVVLRTNLRNLIDMSHQRMCTRAYWEYRELMKDMTDALAAYGETVVSSQEGSQINEWKKAVEFFVPKCELTGFCDEKRSCGRRPAREK